MVKNFVQKALIPNHELPMDPKGFPYEPTLIAFAIGAIAGIYRGMQARAKEMNPTARELLENVRKNGKKE